MVLAAALSLGGLAAAQSASENAWTVCSSPQGPDAGPIITISYSTAPASLRAVVLSPKKGSAPSTRREEAVRRFGGGRSKLKPEIVFEGEGFELIVDTSKTDRPRFPARMRVLSPFGVHNATLSCLQFDIDGDESDCASLGGTWQPQPPACVWETLDSGKACSDSSQCETACVAPDKTPEGKKAKGRCWGKTSLSGTCVSIVSQGTAGRAVCTD